MNDATKRNFPDEICRQLACKCDYTDVPLVTIGDTDPSLIPLIRTNYSNLNEVARFEAIADECRDGRLEFAVEVSGWVYLVNTEAYDYARYCGRLSLRESKMMIAAHS